MEEKQTKSELSEHMEYMRTSSEEINRLREEQTKLQDEMDELLAGTHPLDETNQEKFSKLRAEIMEYYEKINTAMEKQDERATKFSEKILKEETA